MSKFVLHSEANSDLCDIWEYIASDSFDAADRVLDEIYESINSLVRFPRQGHSRSDLTSRLLRFLVVREYVIAYAPDENPLAVIAILHGRRNPRVLSAILKSKKLRYSTLSLEKRERQVCSSRSAEAHPARRHKITKKPKRMS
jgi:antitoxin ParD1/3/4